MKKHIIRTLLILIIGASLPTTSFAWGFWAHKRINRVAVFTLPKGMRVFYRNNIDYLTEHAVDPDKRRYTDPDEAVRHFIDIDRYGVYPYDKLPRGYDDAVAKFGKDSVTRNGIVPWYIQWTYKRLIEAFRKKNPQDILQLSADLGHYIADAHVPLHTTENYDGQLSGQKGIHSFWESRVPELFGDQYNYFVGKAQYTKNPLDAAWATVLSSNIELDSVLRFEKELTDKFPEDQKFSRVTRNGKEDKVYSAEFTKAYSDKLSGQVERRLRRSISIVGNLWMSAWVEAGQPKLDSLIMLPDSSQQKEELAKEAEAIKSGTWKGRPE